ncbi:tyrosine-type recombinase/integrase [Lysinibacillus sp. NPDC093190]|uniref:tyrosine-type recombinase/integrase n=1 Tax=Lysinibacillus sp. NPDC093190 TaxID=3390575 RepID=UPI003D08FFD3
MNEMYCKVREKDTFRFVNKTNKSIKTVSRFLSALKSFYKSQIRLKKYKYSNPMIDSYTILNEHKNVGVRKDKPRMPSEAGTEEPNLTRRLTDSYFKLINDEWQPEIIGDKFLPFEVYKAGKKVNWSLREQVIAHMLFEGGARASEVIELTIGDYRARNSFQEAETFNKGSHGKRVKFIRFSKDTTKLLMRYINKERAKYDESQRTFDELPNDAPVFLTAVGTPFTRQSWYYHWKKAMDKCEMKLNPHKTRHWFVTTSMREIYETSKTDAEITQRKNQLIQYMKWSNKDTIQIYEHYFDEGKHREIHNQMFENMKKLEEEYHKQKKNNKNKKPKLTVLESVGNMEMDEDILEMLEGLE